MKGSCPAPKELWDFLSAPWLRFLGRKSLAKDELGESDASLWTLGAFVPQQQGGAPTCHPGKEHREAMGAVQASACAPKLLCRALGEQESLLWPHLSLLSGLWGGR